MDNVDAPPEREGQRSRRPGEQRLAALVRPALKRQGRTVEKAAEIIGVHASVLSRVLNGRRAWSEELLAKLADVAGLALDDVLLAAGKRAADNVAAVHLSSVVPLVHRTATLHVIVDEHYLDSVLLWWILKQQPFRSAGVTCVLETVKWQDIPMRVAGDDYAIGVFNKKLAPPAPWTDPDAAPSPPGSRQSAEAFLQLTHWADVCVYTGYAIMGRRTDLLDPASGSLSHQEASDFIERVKLRCRKEHNRNAVLVTMSRSTVARMRTPLSAPLFKDIEIFLIPLAAQAMSRFIDGTADLFVGAAAQRLTLRRRPEFAEILHSGNDPFLVSIASIFTSRTLLWERRELVQTVAGLWYEMVRNMRQSDAYRDEVAAEIMDMFTDAGTVPSYDEEALRELLRDGAKGYEQTVKDGPELPPLEYLADRPAALIDPLLRIMLRAARATNPDMAKFEEAFWENLSLDPTIHHATLEPKP